MPGHAVIVEGIIGVGKTTFSKELAKALNGQWLREPDEENGNPYLSDFYSDPKRWAFTMQMHLLNTRYRMHMHAQWFTMTENKHMVMDRSYFGDTAFAHLQVKTGTMTQTEFDTYAMCYQNMTASVLLPQICVHLEVQPSVAQERVQSRMEIQTGRKCETAIDLEYLQMLQTEENVVIDTLQSKGVHVIKLDWNTQRCIDEVKREAEKVAEIIQNFSPPHFFNNIHSRIMV